MKRVKSLFMILSCITFLLVSCTGESKGNISSDPQQPRGNLTTPKQDAWEPTDKSSESMTPPEFDYDPALLSHISIQDGFHIADYGEFVGRDYSYAVFNMRTDDETEDKTALYWEIVVMQKDNVVTVLRVDNEEHGNFVPTPLELVIETDANFDGNLDILICLGHFGNQSYVSYKCFLSTDAGFVHCPSFRKIINPSVDYENRVVRSQWRNWAASHSWGVFKFIEDEFIETERLTEESVYNEAGEQIWSWKEEVFLENKWQTKAYYTQEDFDDNAIQNKLYGANSYWGLDQPKWNTLFNGGKMSDFSIYGD